MQGRSTFLEVAKPVAFVALETPSHVDFFSVALQQAQFVAVGAVAQSFVELLGQFSQSCFFAESGDGFVGFFSVVA